MTPKPSEETAVVLVSRHRGRPTEYEPGFCTQIVDYFAQAQRTMDSRKSTFAAERGKLNRKEEVQRVCADLPTFSNFARRIDVSTTTLTSWRRMHPEFDETYLQAKDIQKNLLIQNGLAGLYAPQAFIFAAKNITDMTDGPNSQAQKAQHRTRRRSQSSHRWSRFRSRSWSAPSN